MSTEKTKKSFKERLAEKRKRMAQKGGSDKMIFLKEGTLRVRILNVGADNDFSMEVVQYYLGPEIKGVISPSTFGLPCAITEKYKELKESKKKADKDLAKLLVPKKKVLIPVMAYKDSAGKEPDLESIGKCVLVSAGLCGQIIDYYLDEEEWGDFMDPENGYDFKLIRSGSGKYDTEYSAKPCKNTPAHKAIVKKIFNLEELVKAIMPTYEETEEKLLEFMAGNPSSDLDEEEERPRKSKKRKPKDEDEDE
jgi:hypothetical protein